MVVTGQAEHLDCETATLRLSSSCVVAAGSDQEMQQGPCKKQKLNDKSHLSGHGVSQQKLSGKRGLTSNTARQEPSNKQQLNHKLQLSRKRGLTSNATDVRRSNGPSNQLKLQDRANVSMSKQEFDVTLGTDFGGLETPFVALRNRGFCVSQEFSSERRTSLAESLRS